MTLDDFLAALARHPHTIEFGDTLSVIERHYRYVPVGFRNGELVNAPGENAGSCRILAFARLHGLDESQTLHCFGRHYREDVLNDPDGDGHRNIRQFMRTGWAGVAFDESPLMRRDPGDSASEA